ncbi:MAG: amidohydrolase family protein [Gemmatimonadota bacterium]|nr:amidohydrolase family protein [Gemmatimonadota bacterium]
MQSRPPRAPAVPPGLAALLILFAAAAPAALEAQPRPTRPDGVRLFAIENARVVTVSGATLDDATVVVDNGIITAVGRGAEPPVGAWVVDGTGKSVYPGLFDAFTTLGHGSAPAGGGFGGFGGFGGPGSGGAQEDPPHSWGPEDRPGTSTWLTAADDIDGADDRFEEWRGAGFTTVLSTLHAGLVPGQAAVLNLRSFDRPRQMVVATPAAMRVNLQDRARTFSGYPGSSMGVFAYLKQLYYDAVHYRDAWAAYEADPRGKRRPEWDPALEPIRMQFAEAWPAFPADTRSDIGRALATTSEMGVRPIVYGAQQAWAAADLLAASGVPALVNLDWPEPPTGGDPEAVPTLSQLRRYDRAPTTPAVLAEAGVRFAFYSGGLGGPDEVLPAVRRAVAQGLAEEAAIRALTLAPAEIFGVADRLGSIDEGKIANLIVADGGLLDEETRVEVVFVDGEMFEMGGDEEADEEEEETEAEEEGEEEGEPGDEEVAEDEEEDEETEAGPRRGRGRGGPPGRGGRGRASGPDPAAPPVPMSANTGPYRDDPVTLITGATVLTASHGTLEDTDILIRDGRIAEIGTGLSAPPGTTVVDASGRYVTPGIIDAHSHMAAMSINEGTVNVSSMVTIEDVIRPEDIGMYRALAGGVTTINILHGSANPIGGGNAVIKLRWGADADYLLIGAHPGIKFALGENTKRDRDPDRYPASRMGVQDVIRQAFLDAREYMAEWDAYEAGGRRGVAPRRDLKLEALMQILKGERWVHSHCYRADEILQLLRLGEEFGFTVRTLQHVLEGYKIADEIAAHGAGASTFSDWWAYKVEAYDAIPHNAALMTERGVLVTINSDSGEEIRHLNQEAAKAIKWGGLDEERALRLVTLNAAIQFGIDDRTGSIDEGKDADLVVWDGHPLSMYGKAVRTYVDGKLYFDIDMDRERQAAIEAEKEALIEKHLGANR